MLKSEWLNMDLDVNFMTLNNLKYYFFMFHEFIINLRASLQEFVKNQFNVVLSYSKQNLGSCLFNITYLHTTCPTFWNM